MNRVLIVDDKLENLYLLRALLQGHGYAVDEARHGAEALVKARQAPPHLIISDLLMPVMDGYTLLRQWKADERLKAIPFVVYTATYTEPKDERLALDLGADAFIIKPAEPEPFMARILEVLAKAQRGELLPADAPKGEEKVLLKEYSEVLVRKLEDKALQLEKANRALTEDIARRQQAEAALQVSEERLRLAVEGANLGTWHWNLRTGELVWSDRCLAMFGLPPGTPMSYEQFLAALHPDDRARADVAVQCALQERTEYDIDLRSLWPDGTVHWAASKGRGYYDDAGRPVRMEGLALDITARKQGEEKINQQLKELRQWYQTTLGREDRVRQLKREVNELRQRLGEPLRYPSQETGPSEPPTA